MTVAYAAVHRRLHYRGEDTKLYALAFADRTMFFARQPPRLFDAMAKPIALQEVFPGTRVNVKYHVEKGINRMTAVQIARHPVEEPPFDAVSYDDHG
jgi:hypothetical protein